MTAGPFGGCPSSRPRATFDFPRIESTYVEYKRSLQGVGTKKIRWSDSIAAVLWYHYRYCLKEYRQFTESRERTTMGELITAVEMFSVCCSMIAS